ncbi:MAG: polyprenyl synthetase family protein [Candidatus Margulisiibacteriota bacterium]|mgnify:CR=1 FL=1
MTSLTAFFETFRPQIDQAMSGYLTFGLTDPRHRLEEAMQYAVLAPAKRIRPFICIATFALFSKDTFKILPVACAFEIVHTYSLIHDDLPAMDNDDFRRGQPTVHKKFGEDIAILAGDTLNTFCFELLAAELPAHYAADKILAAMVYMSRAFGIHGMSGGQVLDLAGSQHSDSQAYLEKTHALKTGAMLKACVMVPAILEGADDPTLASLDRFGTHLGLLFQIVDDILDVTGTTEDLGKTGGKDIMQNKLTYVSFLGLDGAKEAAAVQATSAKDALSALSNRNTDTLNALITFILTRTN